MFSEFEFIINHLRSTEEKRLKELFHHIDADSNRRGLLRSSFPVSKKNEELRKALGTFNDLLLPKFSTFLAGLGTKVEVISKPPRNNHDAGNMKESGEGK